MPAHEWFPDWGGGQLVRLQEEHLAAPEGQSRWEEWPQPLPHVAGVAPDGTELSSFHELKLQAYWDHPKGRRCGVFSWTNPHPRDLCARHRPELFRRKRLTSNCLKAQVPPFVPPFYR